jgi:biotin carboxylase
MPIPVLLVATATRWFAGARMPRALAKAGFEPSLLAPRGSLAEHSGFLSKAGYLPDGIDPMEWVFALAAIAKATSPRLIVPCDDPALRLLHMLALAAPERLEQSLQSQLASLIRDSLGDPAHYRDNLDKTLLPAAAEKLGVSVPPHVIAAESSEAQAFAVRHGFPVVVKGDEASKIRGLAICEDTTQLASAFEELKRAGAARVLVQAYVDGTVTAYPAVAWKGALLVGYARTRFVAEAEPTGVPGLNRCYASPELRALAVKLAAGFGINGFFAPEFIEDARTGQAYLLGVNRRIVSGAHRGAAMNADHWAALNDALQGSPSPTRSDLDAGEEHIAVDFPQEWLRDSQSHWLSEYPVDAPWDDPKLFEAMLAVTPERP